MQPKMNNDPLKDLKKAILKPIGIKLLPIVSFFVDVLTMIINIGEKITKKLPEKLKNYFR